MCKRISIVILILLVLVIFEGCSPDNEEIQASWGQELTLAVGQIAVLDGGSLKIKFETVTGDSRCPKGVNCIQAGEAKCRVLIGNDLSFSVVDLHDKGGISGYSEAVFQNTNYNVKLSFKVEPYPEADKQTNKSDYKLRLTVTKSN